MFDVSEINFVVLQYVQAALKQDFQSARITFGLSQEVAETIKNAPVTNVREFALKTDTPLFSVSNPKDNKLWTEHAASLKHDIPRLGSLVNLRAIMSSMAQAAA